VEILLTSGAFIKMVGQHRKYSPYILLNLIQKGDIAIMQNKNENILNGKDNKRLGKAYSTNSEGTAAWANSEQVVDVSHVSIPAEYDVIKAKNWVDNGSQL
jgi:hypothetical protein